MTLSSDDLDKTVRLAHITILPEKKKMYLAQMNAILDQVQTIDALDLDGVEPMDSVLDQEQYQRDDVEVSPDDLLLEKNAPVWESDAFRVPRILSS